MRSSRVFSSLVLLLVVVASVQASSPPADVFASYFPSRSGQLVWRDLREAARDSAVLSSSSSSSSLDDVARVVAREFGLDAGVEGAPVRMERPSAALLVRVEGLGLDDVADTTFLRAARRVPVGHHPATAASIAATLATGQPPAKTGVPSAQWEGQARVPSLATRLRDAFGERSLLVSISDVYACAAGALCTTPSEAQAAFDAAAIALSKRPELQALDLSDARVVAFASELLLVSAVSPRLQTEFPDRLRNGAPDAFTFAISSFASLPAEARPAAIHALDVTLERIVEQFKHMYAGRELLTHIVLQGRQKAPRDDVAAHVRALPGVTAVTPHSATVGDGAACETVRAQMVEALPDLEAHCMPRFAELSGSSMLQQVGNSTVTQEDINEYQITLWLAIVLSFVVLAASCAIGTMEFERDTLLYSKFNPHWQSRSKH